MTKVKRDNRISRLKRENEELKKDLRRAEKMLELLTDMTTHMVEKLITDNESLENLNEHLHEAAHKMVCRNAELRRKLKEQPAVVDSSLEVEIAKLKDDLRIEKDGRKGLFAQNERLKTKNERLTEEIKNLKIDKEYDKHSAEDLRAIATERGKTIDELKEKVKDLEAKAIEDQQELIAAHDKINKLEAENKELFGFIHYWLKEKNVSKIKPAEIIAGMVDAAKILFNKYRKAK